ncbi:amino acid permease-domain-containing protein [Blastocladiella britannica]|nr:amino acid permease-domain-containing protein [Blastocladiella britannica]
MPFNRPSISSPSSPLIARAESVHGSAKNQPLLLQKPVTGSQAQSQSQRPSATPDQENAAYLACRKLMEPFAGHWELWAFMLGVVISAPFAGWQTGILFGYSNFIIAFVLCTIMYVALALSIAELASALPFASGPAAFAQAAFSSGVGAFTGIVYTISYTVLSATVLTLLSYLIETIIPNATKAPAAVWWILISIVMVTSHWSPKFFFRSTVVGTVYSCLLLVMFAIAMMVFGKEGYPPTVPVAGNTIGNELVQTSCSMGDGPMAQVSWKGIVQAFPFACWLYIGIEAFPVTAEETKSNLYDSRAPKSVIAATAMLVAFGILCIVASPAAADPYLAIFAVSDHPTLDRLVKLACARLPASMTPVPDVCDPASYANGMFVGPTGPISTALIVLTLLPPVYTSLTTSTFAAARHIYTLSRSGVIPTKISITTKHGSPFYATVLAAVIQIAIAALVQAGYSIATSNGTVESTDPLCPSGGALLSLNILKVSAWVSFATYVLQFAAYIAVQRRLPTLPRPFTSPLGRAGAAVGVTIAAVFGLVGPLTTTAEDRGFYAVIMAAALAIMVVFAVYWKLVAQARTALSPERIFVRRQLDKLHHQRVSIAMVSDTKSQAQSQSSSLTVTTPGKTSTKSSGVGISAALLRTVAMLPSPGNNTLPGPKP